VLSLIFLIIVVNIFNINESVKNMVTSIGVISLIFTAIGFRFYFAYLIDKSKKNKKQEEMK
jgi:Kef-type K+ transport system membrane component KefB